MIYVFIHQNFPGQYRHIIRHLADIRGNKIYFVTQPNENWMAKIEKVNYQKPTADRACHPLTFDIDQCVRTGAAVADVCRDLKRRGINPDIIVGHCGWGETLFVKDVYPDVPLLTYFEFFYHSHGVDVDFDPEFTSIFANPSRLRSRNAVNLMSFDACDWGHTPSNWQRNLHPPEMRRRITAIHEGVDCELVRPDSNASITLARDNVTLSRKDEVITYVARNLEPYRGFHIFMRALPMIMKRRPKAHVIIVGGDGVSYGTPAAPLSTYRESMLAEVEGKLDLHRVHFLGQVEYAVHLKVLQVSSAHVYLTYPFVLSWSFVEALASGCLVVGSSTPPVLEVLEDGSNGLTVDFFSPDALADRIDEVFAHRTRMQKVRERARKTAVERFDLKSKLLPRWINLLDDLIDGRRPELFSD